MKPVEGTRKTIEADMGPTCPWISHPNIEGLLTDCP
jgi:hypothetical protein